MNKKGKLMAMMLVLALVLCLLPVSALALDDEAEEAPEEVAEIAEAPVTEAVHNGPEDVLYTDETSVVYNNGGTVYNNGGVVYNNAGLVYNNAGTVYNNAGTVYANGGIVYNNAGVVYNNGATLYDNDAPEEAVAAEVPQEAADPEEAEELTDAAEPEEGLDAEEPDETLTEALPEEQDVLFAEDYSDFAQLEVQPAEEDEEDAAYIIRPREGFAILSAETTAGVLEAQEDGSYSLTELDGKTVVTLSFQAQAPVFSLQPGTYAEEQYLELTAAEGAAIYFTEDGSEPEVGEGRYTGPITIKEGAQIKAIAVAEGAEPSEPAEGAYAVVRIEGPEFADVKTGYMPKPEALVVRNDGPVAAIVTGVELSGADARQFYLSHTSGRKIPARDEIASYWMVQPAPSLKAGTYTALLTVSLDSGETVELEMSFTVENEK